MPPTADWSNKYFTKVVTKLATETGKAEEKYQCVLCALGRVQKHVEENATRRARGDDAPHFDFNIFEGEGNFASAAPEKFRRHLLTKHSIIDPTFQTGGDAEKKSAEVVKKFHAECIEMHKRFPDWTFGANMVQTQLAEAARRQQLKREAMPPLQRLCLMFCENYFSFMSIDRPQTQLFIKEHIEGLRDVPLDRKKLKQHIVLESSKLLKSVLSRMSAGACPTPATLTVDIASTRKHRAWLRFMGVALAVRGSPPVVLCLLTDDLVVKTALQRRGVNIRDDEDEFDDDALNDIPENEDEEIHLTGDACRALLNNKIVALEKVHNFRVIAVTTDNGSNMTKMADEQDGLFSVRCACHTFQLIARRLIREHVEVWNACVEFKKRCEQCGKQVMSHWPLLDKCTTRWNGELTFLKAAHFITTSPELAASLVTIEKMSRHVVHQLADNLLPSLERLRQATLLCEKNKSDMLSLLEAIAICDYNSLCVDAGVRNEMLNDHIVGKLVTPVLVFVAYFCPGYRQRDVGGFADIQNLIGSWIKSKPVFAKLAACAGVGIAQVEAEFAKYNTINIPPSDTFSRRNFDDNIAKMRNETTPITCVPALAALVEMASRTLPSESNLESCFSRAGVFLPPRRANLAPSTLEAQLIVNVAVGVTAALDAQARDAAIHVEPQANAAAAVAAAAVAAAPAVAADAADDALPRKMAAAVLLVLKYAGHRTEDWRRQQRNEQKCVACGAALTNRARHPTRAFNVECSMCHRLAASDCLNFVQQPQNFVCANCALSPTSPWW